VTDERPAADPESSEALESPEAPEAQLELSAIARDAHGPGTNGGSAPPDDAPPQDPPPNLPLPEGEPPPESSNLLDIDVEAAEDPTALDELDDVDEPDDPDEGPSADEPDPAFESDAAAVAATAASLLPTSWPDPIPVGAAAREPTRFEGIRITPPTLILGSLVTLAFVLFVTIEPTPRWLLLFLAVIAAIGTDGILRQAWPRPFARGADHGDTTPYLFLPALAAIAWPMLIEHNIRGYLVIPAALLAGGGYTAMLVAQLSSVRVRAIAYPLTRHASTAAVYLSAFALFSLSYVLDSHLGASVAAVGLVAAMLGVEVFREGEVDPLETLVFAGVTGVILGEARWAMYYVPVGGYLAGLALLLGFFLVTGLLHSHLTRHLNNVIALEYAGIASAGVVLVAIAGQAGLG